MEPRLISVTSSVIKLGLKFRVWIGVWIGASVKRSAVAESAAKRTALHSTQVHARSGLSRLVSSNKSTGPDDAPTDLRVDASHSASGENRPRARLLDESRITYNEAETPLTERTVSGEHGCLALIRRWPSLEFHQHISNSQHINADPSLPRSGD